MIDLALFGSLLLTPLLFLLMPVRRALVTSYCMLWMFLPMADVKLPGIPDLTKPATIGFGALLAITLFYGDLVIRRFRVQWFDIPVILFALVLPFGSIMLNGLGFKAAANEAIISSFLWLVPYFAGRIILGDELGVRELATGIFFAALIYAPLCWVEMLTYPQLHMRVYGFYPSKFGQARRGWGYRPMMFMQHGLMVAMWLVAGACCGVWLLKHKMLSWKLPGSPKLAVGFLVATAALANSMGALLLMIVGLAVLFSMRTVGPKWVLVPLLLITPIYVVSRASGATDSNEIASIVEPISEHRAGSLRFRLFSEEAYVARAMQRPVFGWGGHGRNRPVSDETGKEIGASDGLWIIAFGKTGIVGLTSMILMLLLVPAIVIFVQPRRVWTSAAFAPCAVLCVLLMIYAIDNLMNAMVNPIYMLASGALASYATKRLPVRSTQQARRGPDAPRQRPRQPGLAHPV